MHVQTIVNCLLPSPPLADEPAKEGLRLVPACGTRPLGTREGGGRGRGRHTEEGSRSSGEPGNEPPRGSCRRDRLGTAGGPRASCPREDAGRAA